MASSETVVGAYGSGRTTGKFDPLQFIVKPEVILRMFGVVFSIIVFACISDKGFDTYGIYVNRCVYNANFDACNFGIAIGVISFCGLLVFLATDAFIDILSNVKHRMYIVIADLSFSAAWSFMWLVCFCFITDNWRRRKIGNHHDTAQAAIAFAFFSLLLFIALTVLAALRLRQGVNLDTPNFPPEHEAGAVPPPYSIDATQFSPQPFAAGSEEPAFPATTDKPAY